MVEQHCVPVHHTQHTTMEAVPLLLLLHLVPQCPTSRARAGVGRCADQNILIYAEGSTALQHYCC